MLAALVALRLVVAAVLVVGPWTDEPRELAGWDVDRFEAIATAPGRPWADHAVEYPPGSVAILEVTGGEGVVRSHRLIVALMLGVDLAVTAGLARWHGRRAAVAWLALGSLLLPTTYLRLDLLSAALALLAVEATRRRHPTLGATALVAGTLVKVWPATLLVVWSARREGRALATAIAAGLVAGLVWLTWAGVDAPGQVLGHRGATGWHVESLPGVLAGLGATGPAVLEQGAFRWGTVDPVARWALTAAFVAVAVAVHRRLRSVVADQDGTASHLAALTSTAALLVTSPLLSPQYLSWLLPFAAVLAGRAAPPRAVVAVTALATGLTAAVLAVAGPPGVDGPWAQLALGVRNAVLVALVVTGLAALTRWAPRTGPAGVPTAPSAGPPPPTGS